MVLDKFEPGGMQLLQDNLEFSYETAATIASRERAQLDEYTSKIRFGSVSLNGASLIAAVTVGRELPNVVGTDVLVGAGFFLAGTIAGGISLVSHQKQLARTADKAEMWRIQTGRAKSLVRSPHGSNAHTRFLHALAEAENIANEGIFEKGVPAVMMQSVSLCAWVGGAIAMAISSIW